MALKDNLKPYVERGQKYKGVFYKEHPSRKHGVVKDRQIILRYTISGKTKAEVFGWTSEYMPSPDNDKKFSPEIALHKIKSYRANSKTGDGPTSWTEEKRLRQREREKEQAAQELAEAERKRLQTTFDDYWTDHYLPHIKEAKKPQSWKTELSLYTLWIEPTIGKLKFSKIAPLHLRAINKKMSDKAKSPATVRMAFCVVQQVWNVAVSDGLAQGESPTKNKQAGMPKVRKLNNQRERYLTPEEAVALLAALKKKSERLHDISLLSLHTGMRASEVFSLTWDCVDFQRGTIRILDTKTRSPRTVPLTETASEMLLKRKRLAKIKEEELRSRMKADPIHKTELNSLKLNALKTLVFPAREGKISQWGSKTFRDVVKDLKFNEGVTDRRKKVVFHTLRHSCASMLVQSGVPIYTVSEILGHSSLDMTKRYAHLNEDHKKESIAVVEETLKVENDDKDNQEKQNA